MRIHQVSAWLDGDMPIVGSVHEVVSKSGSFLQPRRTEIPTRVISAVLTRRDEFHLGVIPVDAVHKLGIALRIALPNPPQFFPPNGGEVSVSGVLSGTPGQFLIHGNHRFYLRNKLFS